MGITYEKLSKLTRAPILVIPIGGNSFVVYNDVFVNLRHWYCVHAA